MSTISITKGKGYTAISFTRPIEELKEYVYNGRDLFDTLNLSQATDFWDRIQSLEIYSGRQCVYSCRVTEIKYKGSWCKIILDAWNKDGKQFDYEEEYTKLLRSI